MGQWFSDSTEVDPITNNVDTRFNCKKQLKITDIYACDEESLPTHESYTTFANYLFKYTNHTKPFYLEDDTFPQYIDCVNVAHLLRTGKCDYFVNVRQLVGNPISFWLQLASKIRSNAFLVDKAMFKQNYVCPNQNGSYNDVMYKKNDKNTIYYCFIDDCDNDDTYLKLFELVTVTMKLKRNSK